MCKRYWGTSVLTGMALFLVACDRVPPQDVPKKNVPSRSVPEKSILSETDFASELANQSKRPLEADSRVEPSESIKRFCGDCHAVPKPDRFGRDRWHSKIRVGYEHYAKSGRSDLDPPSMDLVLQYYLAHSPRELQFPPPPEVNQGWVSRFTTTPLDWKDGNGSIPAISSITWTDLIEPGQSHLVVTDMRDGSVSLVNPDPASHSRKVLCRLEHPARVTVCDFDLDGHRDFIVSELGSMEPSEHRFGKVVLFRRLPESTDFESIVLLEKVGRVSDVAVHDFGGDEKPDLVVAEFGYEKQGGIRLMINQSASVGRPRFSTRFLDTRTGTLELALHDWNGDGSKGIAAMISQEHESIELFIHDRHLNRFQQRCIFLGTDPLFGSSGIELVDLDQDGDEDIVYTNGDSFDNNYANRSHGVGWLENLGDFRFDHHRLIELPGAFQAKASDMDNDGDLDLVVTAFLPDDILPMSLRNTQPVSIMMLEQTQPLTFVSHVLEKGTARYPSLEVADLNDDGKMDFVVGALILGRRNPESPASNLPRLTVWYAR